MSHHPAPDEPAKSAKPMTVPLFAASKSQGQKLTVLTAYDYLWAGIVDSAGIDAILVGDSLAMVVQGHQTTLPVTLDEMIYHAKMVVRGVLRALVIVDMPFMTFQVSPQQAVENAGRILKETGAAAVKLEGGVNQAETIRTLTAAEIPVMAHVGLKPQSIHKLGSMRIQRDETQLLEDALAAQEAGAFSIVIELVPRDIAAMITDKLTIPTIGIGAGPNCDGQVLVSTDMLGLNHGFHPKFVKHFANLREVAQDAIRQYVSEVQDGSFPSDEHCH